MREPRHGLVRPFHTPDPKSELGRRTALVSLNWETGENAEVSLLEAAFGEVDRVVEEDAYRNGMPPGPRPAYVQAGLELRAGVVRSALCRWVLSPPARRRGNPGPALLPALIGLDEWHRQRTALPAETSANAVYKATASALGPGIDQDHVRRLIGFWLQRLSWLHRAYPGAAEGIYVLMWRVRATVQSSPPPRNLRGRAA